MKKLLCTAIFVFAFCGTSFAQNNQVTSCAEITITGPSGLTKPGEAMTFTTSVKGSNLGNITYNWTVANGEIVKGQGTTIIEAKKNLEDLGRNLTATVEIEGLPSGCPNTLSETEPVCSDCGTAPILLDEFSGLVTKIEKTRIDKIIAAINNDPNAQLYVMVGLKKTTSAQKKDNKVKDISNLLVRENGMPADRIIIVRVSSEKDLTQFWLVPAGATPPTSGN